MDELRSLRDTRDDTLAPRPEALANAKVALLHAAASERAASSSTSLTDGSHIPLRHRARVAVTTWLVSAHAGTGREKSGEDRPVMPRTSAVATGLLVSGVVLTGGASVWIPQFGVEPADKGMEVDLTIPVEYTTLSGELISCTYAVSLGPTTGRVDVESVLSTLRGQDWATFGEDVKQAAVADPFTETGPEWKGLDEGLREKIAFERAAAQIVIERAG